MNRPICRGLALLCLVAGLLAWLPLLQAQPQSGSERPEKFLPDGMKALKDPDPRVRFSSIDLLIKVGPSAKFAVPTLHEMMREDKSLVVKMKAAEALWVIEQTPPRTLLPVLQSGLKQPAVDLRTYALRIIARMGPAAKLALPEVRAALQDGDFNVRLQAATTLGAMGKAARKAVPDLLALLPTDDLGFLQATVALALSKMGPETIPELVAAQKEKKVEIRRGAMYALMLMGAEAKEAAPAAAAGLRDADAVVRGFAARLLAALGKDASPFRQELEEAAFKDADLTVRCEAALARLRLADGQARPRALEALRPLLTEKDPDVRARAIQVLGEIGPFKDLPLEPLQAALRDKESRVRQSAAETLGKLGPASWGERTSHIVEQDLAALLRDKEVEVAIEAALAIWRLKSGYDGKKVTTAQLVNVLRDALEELTASVQLRALSALAEIGPEAGSAARAVAELLQEDDERVRTAARATLARIAPKTTPPRP